MIYFFVTTSWSSLHVRRIYDHSSSFLMRILENGFFHNLCNHSYIHKCLNCLQFFLLQKKILEMPIFLHACLHMHDLHIFLKTDFKKWNPKVIHVFVFDRYHQIIFLTFSSILDNKRETFILYMYEK